VDDLDEELSELQLSEEEWEKAEVLLAFSTTIQAMHWSI